jgi:mono/diheme cytochrome c family protein
VSFQRILFAAVAAASAFTAGAALAEDGASLFKDNCSACHQVTGKGVPGSYPPLARNKFVQGDPKGPAYVVTHGRGGMPNFSEDLDDRQIALILTYVRTAWGNKAPALTPAVVHSERGSVPPPSREAMLPFH